MARLFTCGFEENDFTTTIWTSTVGTPTIVTTPVNSGTYAGAITAGAARQFTRNLSSNVTSGTYFVRAYLRIAGAPSFDNREMFTFTSSGLADAQRLQMDTNRTLEFVNVITSDVITGPILVADTWYRIEMSVVVSDTAGTIELLVDGVSQGSVTAIDTLSTNLSRFAWGSDASNFGSDVFWDDIAINDATGSFQTSWPGAGKIALIEPASDVSITWEDDDLIAAATFANINELPGAAGDTAYNVETVTLNSIDQFGITALPAEVPSDADMILMDLYARVGSDQANAATARFKIWDETPTLTTGPNIDCGINGWRIGSVGTTNEHQVFELGTRTKANTEAFNIGYENLTDVVGRDRRVSTLWANVEWIEAPGPGGGGGGMPHMAFW